MSGCGQKTALFALNLSYTNSYHIGDHCRGQRPPVSVGTHTMRLSLFLIHALLFVTAAVVTTGPGGSFFWVDDAVAAPLKGDMLRGRVMDRQGRGVAGAEVQLLDKDATMMDLSETDKNGFYTLDLGTLDESEMRMLHTFYVQVKDRNGRQARHDLSRGVRMDGKVIYVEDIILP